MLFISLYVPTVIKRGDLVHSLVRAREPTYRKFKIHQLFETAPKIKLVSMLWGNIFLNKRSHDIDIILILK